MNKKIRQYIDKYYSSFMWMNRAQYEHVLEEAEKKEESTIIVSMSEEDFYAAIESIEPQMKEVWFKQLSRMNNMAQYYAFPQKIYPIKKASEIRICCRYEFQKLVGKFKAIISPYYNYNYDPHSAFKPEIVFADGDGNEIVIPFTFPSEDRYILTLFEIDGERETEFLTYCLYAVEDDLYAFRPYKADLHMHTTFSDGFEPPALVVASARENGMDICAVTDHNNFQGSIVAREEAKKMELNLTVLLGEEYSLAYSPMHIVSLGTDEPVDRYYLSCNMLEDDNVKEIINNAPEMNCSREAYACTQVLLKKVKEMGGITILAHPFWKPINADGTRMDTPEGLFAALASNRRFAGIEIVSGSPEGECDVSGMQAALAHGILNRYEGIPVTGITDSHHYSTDPICGKHFTIIFAKSRESDDVLEALRQGMCVAVEMVNGRPMCYGQYRLVKYGHYLADFYFPERDKKAQTEAVLANEKFLVKSISEVQRYE